MKKISEKQIDKIFELLSDRMLLEVKQILGNLDDLKNNKKIKD